MIFKGEESLLIAARRGSPLAVGYGDKEAYLGSDAFSLSPFTNRVAYLEDGDLAVVRGADVVIYDANGKWVARPIHIIPPSGGDGRQRWPPPFHGQGNPRAAGSRWPHHLALCRRVRSQA